ncbi:MAG: hypothetical protein R3B48_30185 [Kofleriaceae bacterium]
MQSPAAAASALLSLAILCALAPPSAADAGGPTPAPAPTRPVVRTSVAAPPSAAAAAAELPTPAPVHQAATAPAAASPALAASSAAAELPAPAPSSTLAPTERAASSTTAASRYTLRPSVMLGLGQWIVFGGGNVAAQVKTGRMVFEYSHGQALHYNRLPQSLTDAERDADIELECPWTTGGGAGVQITPNLHVLIEVKAHHYLVRDTVGDKLEYTTFTIGPGIFYDYYVTRRLYLQPSLRWWPTIASTLDEDHKLTAKDGSEYTHARHDLVPFVNVSLGWTFDGR